MSTANATIKGFEIMRMIDPPRSLRVAAACYRWRDPVRQIRRGDLPEALGTKRLIGTMHRVFVAGPAYVAGHSSVALTDGGTRDASTYPARHANSPNNLCLSVNLRAAGCIFGRPGQGRREHVELGRPRYLMSCELGLLSGCPSDQPGSL